MSLSQKKLKIILYTRASLFEEGLVRSLVESVCKLFQDSQIAIAVGGSDKATMVPVDELVKEHFHDFADVGALFADDVALGQFSLSLECLGRFNKLSASIVHAPLEEPLFVRDIVELFQGWCEDCRVDLGFAYVAQAPGYDVAYESSQMSIAAGLRDVYWLNLYGKPFAEMIGAENLLALENCASVFDTGDSIFVELSSDPFCVAEKEILKSEIGSTFFVDGDTSRSGGSEFGGGPVAFLKHLWSIVSDGESNDRAVSTPSFD